MLPDVRQSFNAAWTAANYDAMRAALTARIGLPVEFPVSETPCFFSHALMAELGRTGAELIAQAMRGEAAAAAERIVHERFIGPGAGEKPTFLQVDFGLVRQADGRVVPKLVELQAFPSLYGFQTALAAAYQSAFEQTRDHDVYLSGLNAASYRELLAAAICGTHDPREVILMEIAPHKQKTRPDFAMTEQLWGVRAVDTADVVREGRALFYDRDGVRTRIRRVYNRVIPDELERKGVQLPFDYRDDLDVEWTGHPEWFFRISKFSIPWLRHDAVPHTWFLHQVTELPLPRAQLLLKPLFSFAGGGIIFEPTDEQLAAIPADKRHEYILQERIHFTPVIETPHGPTQVEIRMMYVWTDELRAVLPLLRMGRGKMMGVDHNKGLKWVGASAGFIR